VVKVVVVRRTPDAEWLVCEAARGDYMQVPPWTVSREEMMKPVKGDSLEEKKTNLIRLLMDMGHWGPFEMPSITFGIEGMSRVTMAQITRHRLASFDIQSQRYCKMSASNVMTPPSITAEEVISRKGGRKKIEMPPADRLWIYESALAQSAEAYKRLVQAGVPVEDARYVLPNAQLIHGHMTANARSLAHIIALRSFGDAQHEIKDLTSQMLNLAKDWMPITFSLFEERMKKRDVIAP
jgi:thymidylate synthase (FAD)